MIKLEDASITKVLPQVIGNSAEVQAMDYALSKQLKKIMVVSEKTRIWSAMNTLSSKMLDIMALELRTHYYDETLPIDVKRKLVINTMYRYQKAGTPKAVEELITIIFGSGYIEEWFEYGGEPHHFRAITDNVYVSGDQTEVFNTILDKIKRKSSHLDSVTVLLANKFNIQYGFAMRSIDALTLRQEG